MQLVIVTGLSGSGKTIALRVFEDSGYYCIDNLPATLLPHIQNHVADRDAAKVAVSIDSRSIAIESLPDILQTLKAQGIAAHLLFLDASLETLQGVQKQNDEPSVIREQGLVQARATLIGQREAQARQSVRQRLRASAIVEIAD